MPSSPYDEVWRSELPHVVAALTRRYGHFDDCEDAAQRALIAASEQWPRDGMPSNPRAWLLRSPHDDWSTRSGKTTAAAHARTEKRDFYSRTAHGPARRSR